MRTGPVDYPAWFKAFVLALVVVNLVFFLAPLSAFFERAPITVKDLMTWGGSLVSTFVGAWLAFRFAELRRDRERRDKELTAGNAALSTLAEMWDRQKQFQRDFTAPFRDRQDAWLNLPVGTPLDSLDIKFDRAELAFLLRINAAIWQNVVLEERRFHLVAGFIRQREELMLSTAWPKLAEGGMRMQDQRPANEIENILGPDITRRMHLIAPTIIKMIDENVASSMAAFQDLRAALKKAYPGEKFVDLTPKPGF